MATESSKIEVKTIWRSPFSEEVFYSRLSPNDETEKRKTSQRRIEIVAQIQVLKEISRKLHVY